MEPQAALSNGSRTYFDWTLSVGNREMLLGLLPKVTQVAFTDFADKFILNAGNAHVMHSITCGSREERAIFLTDIVKRSKQYACKRNC